MRWTKTDGFFLESLRMVECATADDVLECFREGVKHKVYTDAHALVLLTLARSFPGSTRRHATLALAAKSHTSSHAETA